MRLTGLTAWRTFRVVMLSCETGPVAVILSGRGLPAVHIATEVALRASLNGGLLMVASSGSALTMASFCCLLGIVDALQRSIGSLLLNVEGTWQPQRHVSWKELSVAVACRYARSIGAPAMLLQAPSRKCILCIPATAGPC